MARATHVWIARLGFVALLALHLDFWREPSSERLWFGWVPEELAWRLAWMAAAFAYLLHFCRYVWTSDEKDARAVAGGTARTDADTHEGPRA